jgi:hypothetical protein
LAPRRLEDFPQADRQFVEGLRRLTRLAARSSEKVLDLDSFGCYLPRFQ